jgi:hypothetical protein
LDAPIPPQRDISATTLVPAGRRCGGTDRILAASSALAGYITDGALLGST